MTGNLSLQLSENVSTFDHGAAVMITGFPWVGFIASRLVIGGDGRMPFAVLPVGLIFFNEMVGFIEDLEVFGIVSQSVQIECADDGFGLDPPDLRQAIRGFIEWSAIIEASLIRVIAELERIIE